MIHLPTSKWATSLACNVDGQHKSHASFAYGCWETMCISKTGMLVSARTTMNQSILTSTCTKLSHWPSCWRGLNSELVAVIVDNIVKGLPDQEHRMATCHNTTDANSIKLVHQPSNPQAGCLTVMPTVWQKPSCAAPQVHVPWILFRGRSLFLTQSTYSSDVTFYLQYWSQVR